MAKIKDDFYGVIYARTKDGELVKLRAGDMVPSGVEVRSDLHAPTAPKGGTRGKPAGKSTRSDAK